MKISRLNHQSGFTLVELLFSTVFFSFILIVAMAGFIQINRAYQKGQTVKRVQQDTRNALAHIVDTLSTAKEDATVIYCNKNISGSECPANPNINRLCVGEIRYAWNVGPGNFTSGNAPAGRESFEAPTSGGPEYRDFSMLVDNNGNDCINAPISNGNTLLLDPRVAVGNFNVEQLDGGAGRVYQLALTLTSNTEDLLSSNTECDVTNGDQYCDTATLSTVVTLRN